MSKMQLGQTESTYKSGKVLINTDDKMKKKTKTNNVKKDFKNRFPKS